MIEFDLKEHFCPCVIFKEDIDCTEFCALFFADFCFGHGVTLNSGATVAM